MTYKENGTKNLKHIWSVLCSSSVLDQDTNNLSLNNLVEQVSIKLSKEDIEKKKKEKTKGFAVPIQLQVVTRIMKMVKESSLAFELKLDLVNPDGEIVNSMKPVNIALKKGLKNIRVRNNIPVLFVDKEGEYMIIVSIKEAGESKFTEVDRVPLDVVINS
jgi:hypothetical protein